MARRTRVRCGAGRWLALLLATIAPAACSTSQAVAKSDGQTYGVLRIGTDPFIASLAKELSSATPHVEIRWTGIGGPAWNAIQRNELDLALVPANTAYFTHIEAVQNGTPRDAQLRAISALHVTPFILVVRPESGIHSIRGLRGCTIARSGIIGPPTTAPRRSSTPPTATTDTTRLTEALLSAFGVSDDVRIVSRLTLEENTSGFKNRTLDAAFGSAYFQDEIFRALTANGARVIPIEGSEVDGLQQRFPFIRHAVVAANSYPGQTSEIRTIGVDLLLVGRSGLDAELVYQLTRRYFAALPRLLAATDSVGRVELERASASPIPLHDGAARYYREAELYR